MQNIEPFVARLAIPVGDDVSALAEIASSPAAAAFSRTTIDVKTADNLGSDD